MAYNIKNSVGTVVATIADNAVDTSTSITLIGKNYVGYGEKQNQNFYYMLENFAKSTSPSNPVVGQLWYDIGNSVLKVYNGSAFNDLASSISNGNSNVRIAANSNVTVSVTGNANVLTVTGTGANVAGTLRSTGNANVGNLGTATAIITTGNITTINNGLLQNGTSNIRLAASGNITTSVGGTSNVFTVSTTGANITGTLTSTGNLSINSNFTVNASNGNTSVAGTLGVTGAATFSTTANVVGNANVGNLGTAGLITATGNVSGGNLTTAGALSVTGNANVGNLGTTTLIATTGNITTINSGLVQNGTSNVTITSGSNVSIFVNGNATARAVFTNAGANIAGTANVGNLSTAGIVTATGNITTSGFFIGDGSQLTNLTAGSSINNGNSNVRVAANANVTVAVTGADRVTFAANSMTIAGNILPSTNNTRNLGSASAVWNTVYATTGELVAVSAEYADLAENYWSDSVYEAGTVVKIGGTREITICEEECSDQVFGCISLAPAYLMNNNNFENYQPVVLIGRSVIKVIGKANKGDRLVSAGNGCARKANTEELNYQTEIGRLLVDKNYEEVDLVEAFISTK